MEITRETGIQIIIEQVYFFHNFLKVRFLQQRTFLFNMNQTQYLKTT